MTDIATVDTTSRGAAASGPEPAEGGLEQHRAELTAYCYRMLGSAFEADDAVQETMVRAWRGLDRFEGRAALHSWLYRIATNVCLDMLKGRQRRVLSIDLGPALTADARLGLALPDSRWIEPVPDASLVPAGGDPAEVTVLRETIRLAFVAALQHPPPRQRAVLILREVLQWQAKEVAELLDTSVASVNSALQRARATVAAKELNATDAPPPMDDEQRALLARYVDAFERYDMDSLTALLHEDASWSMPPYELWLRRLVWRGQQRNSFLLPRSGEGTEAPNERSRWRHLVRPPKGPQLIGPRGWPQPQRNWSSFVPLNRTLSGIQLPGSISMSTRTTE